MTMEGPRSFGVFFFKKKEKLKKRLGGSKKKHTVILGQWGHGPTDLSFLAPKAALTLPSRWVFGVTGSWGASSLHSKAPSTPPAGPL